MKFSFQTALTIAGLIFGVTLTTSSESPIGVWFGLELNMISFICFIMLNRRHSTTSEVMLKYFLVQAPASFVLVLLLVFTQQLTPSPAGVLLAMSLKAGVAPFHFWLPQVSESLSWPQLLTLLTLQKLAPLSVISSTLAAPNYPLIILLASLSALTGGLGGLNETSLRKLLAFSSIAHLSWMLTCMLLAPCSWFTYFLLYSFVSASLLPPLNKSQITHTPHIWTSQNSISSKISILIALLSLMGLPPLLGFLPKLMVLSMLLSFSLLFLTLTLLASAMITLYYYLRLALIFIYLNRAAQPRVNYSTHWKSSPTLLNLSGLMFLPALNFIYN